jgi:hypothetical protein
MTIPELLALREPLFKEINKLVLTAHYDEAFDLLNTAQPDQWIKTKKSHVKNVMYNYNEIELIEAVMSRLFNYKTKIKQPIIVHDGKKFAVTLRCKVQYNFKIAPADKFTAHGIASEVVANIEWLRLASPAARSNAFKNACASMGKLLGGGMNRGLEESLPNANDETDLDKKLTEEYFTAVGAIKKSKSKAQAMEISKKYGLSLHVEIKKIIADMFPVH